MSITSGPDVAAAYDAIATDPKAAPFACGSSLAEEVGYPREILQDIPAPCVERFCGLSNLAVWAPWEGQKLILDVGCGSGLDTLILGQRTGATIVGVDFSDTMLSVARKAAREVKLANVTFTRARANLLPFADQTFEAAVFNGILNLNRHRLKILQELRRVLKPDASLWASEIVLQGERPPSSAEANWFA